MGAWRPVGYESSKNCRAAGLLKPGGLEHGVRGCKFSLEQLLATSCVQLFAALWCNKQDTTNNTHATNHIATVTNH
jgi:hypothetical protein